MPDLHSRLAFFLATDALKETQRANWLYSTRRFETVAEHSWHATLLAMLFADTAPAGVDHNHVRNLLIVHDLVEVYAGDTPAYDEALLATEAEREARAGKLLMALLPDDMWDRFDALWREFQAQETEEARFARAIDTLHPLIMSWSEGGPGQSNPALRPSMILNRKRPAIGAYPVLWEMVVRLVQGAVDRGLIPPDDAVQRSGDQAAPVDPGNLVASDSDEDNEQLDLFSRLAFFLATDALKEVQRANRIHTAPRFENVAEHSWHAMLLAMLFQDAAQPGTDLDRVGDILIIHDLVEVYAGDTPLWNTALQESEAERERDAASRLIALLPDDVHQRFDALVHEFLSQKTEEARFARAIDSLHPLVVSWTEGGYGHPEHEFTPSWLIDRKRSTLSAYPTLWELALKICQDAVNRGALPPDDMVQRRAR